MPEWVRWNAGKKVKSCEWCSRKTVVFLVCNLCEFRPFGMVLGYAERVAHDRCFGISKNDKGLVCRVLRSSYTADAHFIHSIWILHAVAFNAVFEASVALLSVRVYAVGAAIVTFFQYHNLRYSQQTWSRKKNEREREMRTGIGINQMCMETVCIGIHVTNDWCSYCASFDSTYTFFPSFKKGQLHSWEQHSRWALEKKTLERCVCVCVFSHFFKNIYIHLFHRLAAVFFLFLSM